MDETLVRGIQQAFPGQQIISEEHPIHPPVGSSPVWYIDPIDGTKALLAREDHFAVFAGRRTDNAMDFGVMFYPARGSLFMGGSGCRATLNGRDLNPDTERSLRKQSVGVVSSSPIDIPDDLRRPGKYVTRNLALLDVVAGRIDAAIFDFPRPVKLWDLAASFAIAASVGVRIIRLDRTWQAAAPEAHTIRAGKYLVAHENKIPSLREVLINRTERPS